MIGLLLGSIAFGFFRHSRGQGPRFKSVSVLRGFGALALTAIGSVGLLQRAPGLQIPVRVENDDGASWSFRARCPLDFTGIGEAESAVSGLQRVTRHPSFYSIGALCAGSALATPYIAECAFYCGAATFILLGTHHQDYRFRNGIGGPGVSKQNELEVMTSNFPFLALLDGRQSWKLLTDELKWGNILASLCISGILHARRLRRP